MLTPADYDRIIVGETKLLCTMKPGKHVYGWTEDMDGMVGLYCTVTEIDKNCIKLAHPFHGKSYSFDPRILAMMESPEIEVKIKDNSFKVAKALELDFFANNCLSADYSAIKKMMKSKRMLEFDNFAIEHIEKNCPRVFGVLMSRNKLRKVG